MSNRLCFLILFLLPLCAQSVKAQAAVRSIDFHNFSYPFDAPAGREPFRKLGATVVVRDGVAYAGKSGDSLSYLYFKVAEVLYGDLTGDGRDEAAVVAIYGSGSGNFYLTNVYFFTLRGGKPVLLAVLTEDRVRRDYRGHYNHDGQVVFEALEGGREIRSGEFSTRHLADGAHCCPASVAALRYRLGADGVELLGIEKRSSLAGDEKMKASYDK